MYLESKQSLSIRASTAVKQKQNYKCSFEKKIFSNNEAVLKVKGLLVNDCHQYLGKYCWKLFTSNNRLKDEKFHFVLNNLIFLNKIYSVCSDIDE